MSGLVIFAPYCAPDGLFKVRTAFPSYADFVRKAMNWCREWM